ncbi:hypothetical protein VNO77_27592 [Canavalia gladiata]|uniref:FACT complex subunit n=1 Tax=Canavalia gladiata TaxID=3824 RepID=A0AAN9KXK1_CANGL
MQSTTQLQAKGSTSSGLDSLKRNSRKQIHILCSQKKASILEYVKRAALEAVDVDLVLHVKPKNDNGTSLMDAMFHAILDQPKSDGRDSSTFGHILREAPEGKSFEMWNKKLKNNKFCLNGTANRFSTLFAVKSTEEITFIREAAYLTATMMKNFVVSKLENVIDEEKKVLHSTLMEETEKDFASGITGVVGAKYKNYCSNIAKTFLIDADHLQSRACGVLLKAHEVVIGSSKPGNGLNTTYQAAFFSRGKGCSGL